MATKQPEKDIQCEHGTPTTPHVMSYLTGSEASQTAGSNVNDITNESLLQAIQDLSNRLGSLEKENRELKTQLIAEQLQSITKEFLPNLFSQKGETNNNISGLNLNSIVSEVIKKSPDPIAHISQREESTKERAIAVDDIVGFTRFADEVPQVVIDEYTTPRSGTRTKTSKGKERGDGSFFLDAPKSSKSGPNRIGIRIGLGSRSQKSSSIVRQLFQSTPPPEVRPVKRPRTKESNKYRQFNPYINGTPSQALSPVIRAADPKGKFECIIPKHDVLSNQTVRYILNKYNDEWMPHTRDLETIFVPVLDDTHWYLVVATLLEHKVCWLDTNSVIGLGMSRLSDIEKLVGCLSAIMPQDMKRYTFPFYNMELKDLPVVQCQGIPNCGNSILSALYVLEWLSMENWFRSWPYGNVVTDICNLIDEDVARMNAMLTLLMSNINEEGSKIQKLAERMFANLKHRKSPSAVAN
ncbi:hypothetical protein RIF29_25174 [Crotalaria pallida]|uniref:Ubiquitin-like protease family profile domain-containing protein n=1 Tax=Crotalaria pallida TaxID=3830 RepID=A0AAN9ENA4_CROPI